MYVRINENTMIREINYNCIFIYLCYHWVPLKEKGGMCFFFGRRDIQLLRYWPIY